MFVMFNVKESELGMWIIYGVGELVISYIIIRLQNIEECVCN